MTFTHAVRHHQAGRFRSTFFSWTSGYIKDHSIMSFLTYGVLSYWKDNIPKPFIIDNYIISFVNMWYWCSQSSQSSKCAFSSWALIAILSKLYRHSSDNDVGLVLIQLETTPGIFFAGELSPRKFTCRANYFTNVRKLFRVSPTQLHSCA